MYYYHHNYHNLLSISSPCILLFGVAFDKLYQNDETAIRYADRWLSLFMNLYR